MTSDAIEIRVHPDVLQAIGPLYSADRLPNLRGVWEHDGKLWAVTGTSSQHFVYQDANVYPLHDPKDYKAPNQLPQYSYEGQPAKYRGKQYVMGKKHCVIGDPSVARPLSNEEIVAAQKLGEAWGL